MECFSKLTFSSLSLLTCSLSILTSPRIAHLVHSTFTLSLSHGLYRLLHRLFHSSPHLHPSPHPSSCCCLLVFTVHGQAASINETFGVRNKFSNWSVSRQIPELLSWGKQALHSPLLIQFSLRKHSCREQAGMGTIPQKDRGITGSDTALRPRAPLLSEK